MNFFSWLDLETPVKVKPHWTNRHFPGKSTQGWCPTWRAELKQKLPEEIQKNGAQ
jgi:hypothetical protein